MLLSVFTQTCSEEIRVLIDLDRWMPLFIEISWSNVSVVVLHVASLCWRPKRSPHQDGQPGRAHTDTTDAEYMAHICKTAVSVGFWVLSPVATRWRSGSSSHAAEHGPYTTTRCDSVLYCYKLHTARAAEKKFPGFSLQIHYVFPLQDIQTWGQCKEWAAHEAWDPWGLALRYSQRIISPLPWWPISHLHL